MYLYLQAIHIVSHLQSYTHFCLLYFYAVYTLSKIPIQNPIILQYTAWHQQCQRQVMGFIPSECIEMYEFSTIYVALGKSICQMCKCCL